MTRTLRTVRTVRTVAALALITLGSATASSPSLAQGSGSKASLSLLLLDDPLSVCLRAGTELFANKEDADADKTLQADTVAQVWAISFDQSVIEVEVGEDAFFTFAENASQGPCPFTDEAAVEAEAETDAL